MNWSRRSVLLSALSAGGVVLSGARLREPAPVHHPPAVRHLQVTAHPDDDILFMQPDLASGIHNRQPTIGIYLTGGESSLPDPARYAAQRQEGTRASYARMAGVPNVWHRATLHLSSRQVEVNELRARPEVRLVFLNIPEDNNPTHRHALPRLWENSVRVPTLLTENGVVRRSYPYDREGVISVLAELFELFRPTTIRLQDIQPDQRYQSQWVGFHDHPDHVIGARFARAAAERYMANHRRAAPLSHYRDYNIADAPTNLSVTDRGRVKEYFRAYAEHDSEADLAGAYASWTEHGYYRWPRGGSWAAIDGRAEGHAFAVHGPWLTHWRRRQDGWSAPERARSPVPLRPVLTLVREGARLVLLAQSIDGTRLLIKRQLAAGHWPSGWEEVPAPPGTQVGTPSAIVDDRGRLVVLVAVPERGVCLRADAEPEWRCLPAHDVQDGITAATGPHGTHVFAATRSRVLHWQRGNGGEYALVDGDVGGLRPAGAPVAVRVGQRIRLCVRTAPEGAVTIIALPEQYSSTLPNPGGITAALLTDRDPPLVFVRNSFGGVSLAPGDRDWIDLGGQVLDHPAVLVERGGLSTLVAQGVDGQLLVNQQLISTEPAFSGWRPAHPEPIPSAIAAR